MVQIIVNQTGKEKLPNQAKAVTNMKTIVIIPAYEPEENYPLTQQLIAKDLRNSRCR